MAVISGRAVNATDLSGYFAVALSDGSGTVAEKLRLSSTGLAVTGALSSTGNATVGQATPTLTLGNQSGNYASIINLTGSNIDRNWRVSCNQYVGSTFEITPSTAGGGTTFSTPAFVVNSSGFVGIGTTSPIFKLDVNTGSDGYVRYASGSLDYRTLIYNSGSIVYTGTWSNSPLGFITNSLERARIDSSGNLLVGTTSTSGNAGIQFLPSSGVASIDHVSGTASGNYYYSFNYAGSSIGSISQVGTTAVLYNTSSDYRLKDITGPLTDSGSFIDALKPKVGTWKADGSKFVGFIAHEFAEVCPSAVTGEKDAVDSDGKPIYQAMQAGTAEVIANFVAELQSLRQRVAALENS